MPAPQTPELLNHQTYTLPEAVAEKVHASLDAWQQAGNSRRLWSRDASLWTGADEAKWMGWLDLPEIMLGQIPALKEIAADVRAGGFRHILLLGMGGSSLCPEVLALTFGAQPGAPALHILDSTDPAQVRAVEKKIDLKRTLFIVASKSGSTLEPNIFKQYFFERATQALGSAAAAGKHFLAITDPGSKMQQVAESDGFRRIALGIPSVGGRYSALSNFGMVPAAAMGLDIEHFLTSARAMATACGPEMPAAQNPGVVLGIILGELARAGRDKLTIITSPGIFDLGAWLEQLVAESTGKNGKAVIPIDREILAPRDLYEEDRLFVYLRLVGSTDNAQEHAVDALAAAGEPLVRILVNHAYDLSQEFFRWEIATAVAGSLLGINPFDQPDVEASKVETRKLTSAYEASGVLPAETPLWREGDLQLFADARNADALNEIVGNRRTLVNYLNVHLSRLSRGDYFALLAYLEMNDAHESALQEIRHAVRDTRRVATCLGFGPRFLHSTGQAYKGGPDSGVFLQITCDDAADLPVPGQKYSFGVVKAAQARGDFEVLAARGRRALRVHLGRDVRGGLATLSSAVRLALG